MKTVPGQISVDDEAIQATAAAWLAEQDGGLSPEQQAEFDQWRSADVRHERAVRRLERAWQSLQELREFRPQARAHPDHDLLRRAVPRRYSRNLMAGVAAALALAAIWLATSRPGVSSDNDLPHVHYVTTVGGYQRMTLPDGSVVDLNASTEIRERFTSDERRIQLVRGEATFTVAKNPARPFVVIADGVAVRAVGTAFNVRLDAGKVDVLVTEGTVEVRPAATAALAPSDARAIEDLPQLVAGQRASVALKPSVAPVVQNVSPAIIREELSWQGPRLVFLETPLAEVVRRFNERNSIQLELGDLELADAPVGGSFRADHVESFVRLLVSDGDIVADRIGPDRIVLRRAP